MDGGSLSISHQPTLDPPKSSKDLTVAHQSAAANPRRYRKIKRFKIIVC